MSESVQAIALRGPLSELSSLKKTRQAFYLCPVGHPDRSILLDDLANACMTRFKALDDLNLLAEAIALRREALDLRSPGHHDRSLSVNNLAVALKTRYEHLGDLDSLAEAVNLHREALALRPPGHRDRLSSLISLANAVESRFARLGDLDSIVEAVQLHREALDLSPPEHSDPSELLSNLASTLYTRYEQLGDLDSLSEAGDLLRRALNLRPRGSNYRARCMNNLANVVTAQFEQLGELDFLTEAIELRRKALNLRPPGHRNRSLYLSNLANALKTRYVQHGDLDSLAEAVILHRQALDLCRSGHPFRAPFMSNLANALNTQFERLREPHLLAEAVDLHRQALVLHPPGHPRRSGSLNNLAAAVMSQFKQSGDLKMLSEAVMLNRKALKLRPPGHPDRAASLNNLAHALQTRAEQRGLSKQRRVSDADEGLGLCREGLHSCADGHPMRVRFLFAIGECMLRPGTHVFHFEDGIRHILDALRDRSSSAHQSLQHALDALRRVKVAYRLSPDLRNRTVLNQPHCDDPVLQVYTLVIGLLPRAASFGLDHAGRLRALSRTGTISRDAATRAVAAGRFTDAVEMLEEGRGVFWLQALRLRATDLDLPPARDARKLRKLFKQLEVGSARNQSWSMEQRERHVEQRRQLSEAAENLIADIRSRPNMERFLRPPAFASLMQALPEGFVVFLNVSQLGHHALVLNGSVKSADTFPLKLPTRLLRTKRKLSKRTPFRIGAEDDTISKLKSEQTADCSEEERLRAGVRERATFEDALADLWVFIVQPVIIGFLHLERSNGRERPRVWWCATGNLSFLPIHAAGGYTKAARERSGANDDCASNYIVSSYIPSFSVLVRARSGSTLMPRNKVKGLLIYEGSPGRGWPSISKVKDEVRRVKERFDGAEVSLTVLNDAAAHPTLSDVLTSLKETQMQILHLACHGAQRNDPLTSAFILRDEDLTLQELMKLDMKQASLAFLSACQTAKGHHGQPDQAVHLAASMLFCGFQSVIATMRAMTDADGPVIADGVYQALFKGEVFDLNLVPYALDDAVRRLREEKVTAERWSVFVHMGA